MKNEFQEKVVVITGGAQGIGRCIAEMFKEAGAHVCIIDKQPGNHFVGDSKLNLADFSSKQSFWKQLSRVRTQKYLRLASCYSFIEAVN